METREIKITIDGKEVIAREGMTVMEAALENGIYIPSLCSHPDLPSVGACRLCITKIENVKGLPTSCTTPVSEGMMVITNDEELQELRKEILSLLLEDHPHACLSCAQREGCTREPCSTNVPVDERCCPKFGNCELQKVVEYVGIKEDTQKYIPKKGKIVDTEPLFRRDYNLCIMCGRCVRACNDLRGIGTIDFAHRSYEVEIATAFDRTFADSACRFCGACVEVCPTGCLMDIDLPPGPKEKVLVPCRNSCPAGVDVPRLLNLVAHKRYSDAAKVVREKMPLPRTIGFLCSRPCEDSCRRGKVNEPIAIRDIEAFTAAHDDSSWKSHVPGEHTGKRIAVVGAGPAGLSCAYFLRLRGHEVTVFEKEKEAGGRMRSPDLLSNEHMKNLDRDIHDLTDIGIDIRTDSNIETLESLSAMGFDALLLAIGKDAGTSFEPNSSDNVFRAGDFASDSELSTVDAIASGRIESEKIHEFLGCTDRAAFEFLVPESPEHWLGRTEGFARMERRDARQLDTNISPEDAEYEAKRCLRCDLRILISEVPLPPTKWLPLDAQTVATVPEKEGVYILIDEEGKAMKIKGTANLRSDLESELDSQAKFFEFEEDPMYSKRESELLQQHLQKYGEMPSGGEDDLDDLF